MSDRMINSLVIKKLNNSHQMSKSSITTYNNIAEEYAKVTASHQPVDMIERFLGYIDSDHPNILDVGCADGVHSEILMAKGAEVIGIDPSSSLIELGMQRNPTLNLQQYAMIDLPLRDQKFDGLWVSATFHHQTREQMPASLEKFHRSLVPNGALYISTKKGTGIISRDHGEAGEITYTLLEQDELENMVAKAGFEVIDIVSTEDKFGRKVGWINVFARKTPPS